MQLLALDQPAAPPLTMPDRFRTEIVFFITPAGAPGVPPLGENEYWIELDNARRWLDELVIRVVSPLDAENMAQIELTEDHEAFLQWLIAHGAQHVRLV